MSGSAKPERRLLTLLVALAILPVLGLTLWLLSPYIGRDRTPRGDGTDVESYGFSFEPLLLPRAQLVAAGFPRDGVPALVEPETMTPAEADAMNGEVRGKYLVSGDRVIGLVIADEARAYPLRVLNWHEVVNDLLGGTPVAVTYHPLCDSAVVFDRRVDGRTLELGVSGLLHNSNLLVYDRQPADREASLWSQLQARAIAGPAAARGDRLRVIPAWLMTWGQWRERHPETTVLRPDRDRLTRYRRDPYGGYFRTGEPPFPVEPWPDAGSPAPMSRVRVRLDRLGQPVVSLAGDDSGVEGPAAFHSLWFAWFASHPGDPGTSTGAAEAEQE